MYEDVIRNTKDLIFKEMQKINAKGDISSADLCNLKYASQTLTSLSTYEAMENEYGEDASFAMNRRSMRGDQSYGGMSYGDESWRRGRGANGQFVSRMSDPRVEPYAYAADYSGHSVEDRTIEMLEHQMDNAKSDYDRQFIQNQIRSIREKMMK
jgi:hypothetical protein